MSEQTPPVEPAKDNPSPWEQRLSVNDEGPLFPSDQAVERPGGNMAIAGLVVGVLSLLSMFLPVGPVVVGVLAVIGIFLSLRGRRSSRSGMANAGFLLSGITLLLTVATYVCLIASRLQHH